MRKVERGWRGKKAMRKENQRICGENYQKKKRS